MTHIEEVHIDVRPHRWRLLRCGKGPIALCLHGAGGSADSFRPLMAHLADHLCLVAPDLPGHGQTKLGAQGRSGLAEMAEDVCKLTRALDLNVHLTIGHSAGAAIALSADGCLSPRGHVLINAALSEFDGLAGWLFPAMAKGLSSTPFAADIISRYLSRHDRVQGLLEATGSKVSDEMIARYTALIRRPDHVKGTLRMMAAWRLSPLLQDLSGIDTPALLIAGDRDGTVPISVSKQAEKTLVKARLSVHQGGHLLHEESPHSVAADILAFANELGDPRAQSL